jgi:bifunctional DNA-binding transcriptional regulator/antitoxin component of YhaV-PrlF toxin-antitoxin module
MQGLYTSKIYNNKTTVPKDIREKLKVRNGDALIWEIVGTNVSIKKNEEKKTIF